MSLAADPQPDWLAGYEDPVVRPVGSDHRRMHTPDADADEPMPDCESAGRPGVTWTVTERVALEPVYCVCGNAACQDELGAEVSDDE